MDICQVGHTYIPVAFRLEVCNGLLALGTSVGQVCEVQCPLTKAAEFEAIWLTVYMNLFSGVMSWISTCIKAVTPGGQQNLLSVTATLP